MLEIINKSLKRYKWSAGLVAVLITAAIFLLIAAVLFDQYPILSDLNLAGVQVFILIYIFLSLIILVLFLVFQKNSDNREIKKLNNEIDASNRRIEAIFKVNQTFNDLEDENEVVANVLKLLLELLQARNVSFVPIDQYGIPHSVMNMGDEINLELENWLEYLAKPTVRESCEHCDYYGDSQTHHDCPLLTFPMSDSYKLWCFPLKRGKRDFGIINVFTEKTKKLDEGTLRFIETITEEVSSGLENLHFRRKELAAVRNSQVLKKNVELSNNLQNILIDVNRFMEADYSVLKVIDPNDFNTTQLLRVGLLSPSLKSFIDKISNHVIQTKKMITMEEDTDIGESSSTQTNFVRAVPIFSPENELCGVMVISSSNKTPYNNRKISVLESIAGQIGLAIYNFNLLAQIEFQAIKQERTRLAREIHDSLAQTLGFLKLQTAQISKLLEEGDIEAVRYKIDQNYKTLSNAYEEARQAIDSLRISSQEIENENWLNIIAQNFRNASDIEVDVSDSEISNHLPPEVNAQLIRILQEALSNIRKHGNARRVKLSSFESNGDYHLEINDDGVGFSPDDVLSSSKYGLRGMRERAELIGADFQIESRPGEGTTVKLRIPLSGIEFGERKR